MKSNMVCTTPPALKTVPGILKNASALLAELDFDPHTTHNIVAQLFLLLTLKVNYLLLFASQDFPGKSLDLKQR